MKYKTKINNRNERECVIPAKAGIPLREREIPAFAGMTLREASVMLSLSKHGAWGGCPSTSAG
jgi:hypothetical protein